MIVVRVVVSIHMHFPENVGPTAALTHVSTSVVAIYVVLSSLHFLTDGSQN